MDNNFPFNHFLDFDNAKHIETGDALFLQDGKSADQINTNAVTTEVINNNKLNGASEASEINEISKINELSEKIISSLQEVLSPQKYHSYFHQKFKIINLSDTEIEFCVNTNFVKKTIENNYLSVLNESIKNIFNKNLSIKITTQNQGHKKNPSFQPTIPSPLPSPTNNDNDIDKSTSATATSKITSAKDARFKIDLYQSKEDILSKVNSVVLNHLDNSEYKHDLSNKKTFDNFVVGSSNNMAYTSALSASKNPGKAYPTLYIHSGSGLGKTHLLHAVVNNIKDLFPALKIHFITARDFMSEMCDAMATKKIFEFRKRYTEQIDVLVVDDVHELKNKQGTQNELFHVFNELHNKHKQLVFTADRPPNEIDGIDDRIKTRLSWGLIVDIQRPDIETRIAILKKKAMDEDIFLSDDVLFYISNTIKDNIRELEGALIRLGAYSSLMQVDVDLEMAKEQLSANLKRDPDNMTIDRIIYAVSRYFKITSADIKSKSRNKNITLPRHIAMYLSNKLLNVTFREIGINFSNRDHTSVIHAVDKIKANLKSDKDLMQTLITIEKTI
ncbi:MAG: chromosomal replication initiator protein DnaA [Oligoflexia bacterium]|nr:chromosomal replication initiator protein DnaA [Oligoflexia bacterium]